MIRRTRGRRTNMENNENKKAPEELDKKAPEELDDEALDGVAGGKSVIITNDPPPFEQKHPPY